MTTEVGGLAGHIDVKPSLLAAQQRTWEHLGRTGTHLRGDERVAAMAEVRSAPTCELCIARRGALSPESVDGDHQSTTTLGPLETEVVHRLTTDPGRLRRAWFDGLVTSGLPARRYVELLSVIALTAAIDRFRLALGLPLLELPAPGDGTPDETMWPEIESDAAWVPLIRSDAAPPELAEAWLLEEIGMDPPNVLRVLSSVPAEQIAYLDLFEHMYVARRDLLDWSVGTSISRGQMELLATRVSALNECFY